MLLCKTLSLPRFVERQNGAMVFWWLWASGGPSSPPSPALVSTSGHPCTADLLVLLSSPPGNTCHSNLHQGKLRNAPKGQSLSISIPFKFCYIFVMISLARHKTLPRFGIIGCIQKILVRERERGREKEGGLISYGCELLPWLISSGEGTSVGGTTRRHTTVVCTPQWRRHTTTRRHTRHHSPCSQPRPRGGSNPADTKNPAGAKASK